MFYRFQEGKSLIGVVRNGAKPNLLVSCFQFGKYQQLRLQTSAEQWQTINQASTLFILA
jgi:hypothetical protein